MQPQWSYRALSPDYFQPTTDHPSCWSCMGQHYFPLQTTDQVVHPHMCKYSEGYGVFPDFKPKNPLTQHTVPMRETPKY